MTSKTLDKKQVDANISSQLIEKLEKYSIEEERIEDKIQEKLIEGTRKYTINRILSTWNNVELDKKDERLIMAKYLKYLIVVELWSILVIVIFNKFLGVDNEFLKVLISGVFVQTLGLVFIIVRYLFDNKEDKYLETIAKIHINKITESKDSNE